MPLEGESWAKADVREIKESADKGGRDVSESNGETTRFSIGLRNEKPRSRTFSDESVNCFERWWKR